MENTLRIFTGFNISLLDSKGRIVISPDFRQQLEEGEKLFVLRDAIKGYPILTLKPSIRTDFSNMNEEERIKEYSAVARKIDRQGRIPFPANFLEYLSNGRTAPESLIQTGGGDRIYVWHPEDFADRDKKFLEKSREQ